MSNGDSSAPREDGFDGMHPIDSHEFYFNYFGHPVGLLRQLVANKPNQTPTIYLVGDSTLDNKYWLPNRSEPHPNAYIRSTLDRDRILCRDIAYWLSSIYSSDVYTVINCAIEQTLLRSRVGSKGPSPSLPSSSKSDSEDNRNVPISMHFEHDDIVREYITSDDVLVVSVGGNDVALSPTCATAFTLLGNVLISPRLGMSVLVRLFKDAIEQYVAQLISKRKPRLVVLCMLYFPDKNPNAQSWAGFVLRILQYNSNPDKLQRAIRTVFERAVMQIALPNTKIAFAPFFHALDGSDTADYVARVEPSEIGGRKMAELLKQVIDDALGENIGSDR